MTSILMEKSTQNQTKEGDHSHTSVVEKNSVRLQNLAKAQLALKRKREENQSNKTEDVNKESFDEIPLNDDSDIHEPPLKKRKLAGDSENYYEKKYKNLKKHFSQRSGTNSKEDNSSKEDFGNYLIENGKRTAALGVVLLTTALGIKVLNGIAKNKSDKTKSKTNHVQPGDSIYYQ